MAGNPGPDDVRRHPATTATVPGDEFTFRHVVAADFALIGHWLAEPHVARWWAHDASPEGVERDFGPTLRGEEPNEDLLILDGQGGPFGLAQRSFWHGYPDEVAEYVPFVDVPADAMTIDYLIGDPAAVGRGRGSALIRALAADTFAAHPGCGLLIVPVAAGNRASWRALEKAGFHFVGLAEATPDNPDDPHDQRVYRLDRPSA